MTAWTDVLDLRIEVSIAIPTGAGVWNQTKWNQGKWVTPNAAGWTPVDDCELLAASWGAGRSTLADNFDTSRLSMTLRNEGGWATGNPRPSQLTIEPGRAIRLSARALPAGGWRVIWCGQVDAATTTWGIDGSVLTNLSALDAMSAFALVDPPATAVPVEHYTTRLQRLATMTGRANLTIQSVGFPGENFYMQAGTLAQQLINEVTLVANSIVGIVGASPSIAGKALVTAAGLVPYSPDQTNPPMLVTNTATPAGATPYFTVCPLTFTAAGPDVSTIANRVQIARAGGTAVVRENTASQALYQLRTWGRSDLLNNTDGELNLVADKHIAYRAWPHRTYQLTYDIPNSMLATRGWDNWLRMGTHPLSWTEATGAAAGGISAHILWDAGEDPETHQPWRIDEMGVVIGVSHNVTPDTWQVTANFDRAGATGPTAMEDAA